MSLTFRRQYAQFITSGAQLFLLVVGWQFNTREGWLYCLGIMAALSLVTWLSALRRLRVLRDTPTSKIVSAAQGYVELLGRGKTYGDAPLLSKLTHLPCLWYRYQVERKDTYDKWRIEDYGTSEDSFLLDDGSGWCVVDPSGAEIITRHKDTWHEHGYRYTEWKLLIDNPLYVIGDFKTLGGSSVVVDTNEEVKAILDKWKQNMKSLYVRFDTNQDGVLDMQEWELARQAAKLEAKKNIAAARNQSDTHYLFRSPEHRLYLISNFPPEKLARRYAFWTWANLVIFFGALGGVAWVMNNF